MNKIRLNNEIEMPQVGMGLFQLKGDETQTYIKQAIEAVYLIHQPMGDVYGSWRALEELYTQEKIKAIGVSNFSEDRLLDFILNTKTVPAVNQIELHPFFHQSSLRKLMKDYGIQVQAWGPLCEGMKNIF